MILKNIVLVHIAVFIPNIFSWTIDLPEIRRHLFEKNEMKKVYNNYGNFGSKENFFYDNIDGNSKHNSEDHRAVYANNFGYEHHKERDVASAAYDGGRYLEGLRRSIESYIGYLENCTRINLTMSQNNTGNATWVPQSEQPLSTDRIVQDSSLASITCAQVTRASEHVRRLAELAMATTRRLQDLAYIEIYQKDVSEEEDELIFKLASFLDRLARLTGFRPNPKKFLSDPPVSTTTEPSTEPPLLMSLVDAPEQVRNALLKCLKENSTVPATVRCAYPLPLTPAMSAIINLNNNTTSNANASDQTPGNEQPQAMALQVGSDSPAFAFPGSGYPTKSLSFNPQFLGMRTYLQRLHKRSLTAPHLPLPKVSDGSVKRSVDVNPTINLMKYYVKHNVWMNSNPGRNDLDTESLKPGNFEVKNDLPVKYVQKRSLFRRKSPPFRRPGHTLKHVKERIKGTLGAQYFKNKEQIIKLKNTLDSIRSITYKKSVTKANIHKRSIHYEEMSPPRPTEDPTQDISYYLKNKKGTIVSPNLVQAAQVRSGLEQAFQTGNIEVVRRYGANYNPLIPDALTAGVIRSMADM